jgi:ligand-binding SRPBCC domain-containing protein
VRGFTVSSRLASPPAEVWDAVTSPEGVNHELWPIVQMTVPRGFSGGLREGSLGRSWILLAGVVPIDYDDLRIASVDPGRGFSERSVMGSCSAWNHDRTVTPLDGGGCRVVDRIGFTPRLALAGGLMALTFEATFRWRHRRLRARFGAGRNRLHGGALKSLCDLDRPRWLRNRPSVAATPPRPPVIAAVHQPPR